jgi:hypothetical protein
MLVPFELETEHMNQARYADLVVYPISPTTAIPATYPMLSGSTEPGEADATRDRPHYAVGEGKR